MLRRLASNTLVPQSKQEERFSMGFRRRVRRRGLLAGALAGGAIARHRASNAAEEQQAYGQAPAEEQAPAEVQQPTAYAPPPADPADEIEHLAQLHTSGALTDEEFAAAKAKVLGT
jgi:Short C-terminal domain